MKATETKIKLSAVLTKDELKAYKDKSDALRERENAILVHSCVLINPTTFQRYVAYIKEPDFMTKVAVFNKMGMQGPYFAAMDLVEVCLLKSDSDPITYSEAENEETHMVKLGVLNFCSEMVKLYRDQFKKK